MTTAVATTPSFCLVADASCDLPAAALSHPQFRLLPVRVQVGGQAEMDRRDADKLGNFYDTALTSPDASGGRSEPLSVDEMLGMFKHHIAHNFDECLGVFVSSSRSAIFNRAKLAVGRARIESYAQRLRLGRNRPLQMDCVDSQALFAGYAAQVLDLLSLVDKGADIAQVIQRQQQTVAHTHAYMVPGNVSYILERASKKGEKSVGALAAFAAKALHITPIIHAHKGETLPVARALGNAKATGQLIKLGQSLIEQRKLLSPHLCWSYSGALREVSDLPEYQQLKVSAAKYGVAVHLEPMSMTGAINVGPQALVMGAIAKPHAELI
jgi:DegV family protein with EDD domain